MRARDLVTNICNYCISSLNEINFGSDIPELNLKQYLLARRTSCGRFAPLKKPVSDRLQIEENKVASQAQPSIFLPKKDHFSCLVVRILKNVGKYLMAVGDGS